MTLKKSTILVPTDFSEVCNQAAIYAADIAQKNNLNIVLIHIYKDIVNEKEIHEKLNNQAEVIFELFGFNPNTLLEKGNLNDTLVLLDKRYKPLFFVFGSHGNSGFQKLTGSKILSIAKLLSSPILVAKENTEGFKASNIVFPVKDISNAGYNLQFVVDFAKKFNSKVHILPKFENDKLMKTKIINRVKLIKQCFISADIDIVDKVSSPSDGEFFKQVNDYSNSNNCDIIFNILEKKKIFSKSDDSLIFNSSLTPVLLINPKKLNKTSWSKSW